MREAVSEVEGRTTTEVLDGMPTARKVAVISQDVRQIVGGLSAGQATRESPVAVQQLCLPHQVTKGIREVRTMPSDINNMVKTLKSR